MTFYIYNKDVRITATAQERKQQKKSGILRNKMPSFLQQ